MKKAFYLILVLALVLGINCAYAKPEKTKLTVWSFTSDLQGMIEKYYLPNHPELDIDFAIYTTDDHSYQDKIDNISGANSATAGDYDPDIFALEGAFVKEYVNSDKTGDLRKIGFTDEEISSIYPFVSQIGQSEAGVQKGLSWQATPGVLLYRESLAKKYLGVNSPEEFQTKVSDWDKFLATAKELKNASQGETKMVTGIGDLSNAYQFSRAAGWVVDGKLNIDNMLLEYAKIARTMREEDLHRGAPVWGKTWYGGMRGEYDTLCYFLPSWGLPYTIKLSCVEGADYNMSEEELEALSDEKNGTYGDWRIAEGPTAYSWSGTWIGINSAKADTADDTKKEAMHDLIRFLTMDEDFQQQYFSDTGDFVSNKGAVKKILDNGGTPDGFLGGQDSYAAFASAAEKVNGSLVSEYDDVLNNLWDRYVIIPYSMGEKDLDVCVAEFKKQAKTAIPSLIVDVSDENNGEVYETNILGDVNGDGEVDGRDVIRLMKYLADENDEGTGDVVKISEKNSDLNEVGEVNELDLLRLLKALAEDSMPIQPD